MKNFIIPIDFSKDSLKGLDIAVIFSKIQHVNVQMVYVYERKDNDNSLKQQDEIRWAEENFERIIEEYRYKFSEGSKLRYIIKSGKICREVVSQAHSYKDSFISASTHGASGFEEFFIGSNAFKIITSANCPVITNRMGTVPEKITKIVAPLVASRHSRQKIPFTTELAKLLNAEVYIIGVGFEKEKRATRKLKVYASQAEKYMQSHGVKCQHEIVFGKHLANRTIEYANEVGAELIAITSERSGGFNLVVGSWGHQIINKYDKLVVNFPPRRLFIKGTFVTTGGM
ncbi:universal stress protein [Bacteroidales bacterium]|nr:universal stress protein [Bacteroidales bacterium]